MARRRPTLRTYLRRRWRTVGLLVVLLLGALLILGITDRGHDPQWEVRAGYVEQLEVAPSGDIVYVLARADPNAPITRLEAHAGEGGALLWKTDLNATRALIAVADDGVALATDFPRAFLTSFDTAGRPRYHVPLEGAPRALAADVGRVAVALDTAGGGQVQVVEVGATSRTHRFDSIVKSIDLRAGHLAAGTSSGSLALFAPNGTLLHETRLDLDIVSLRLAADARVLIAGGYARNESAFSGGVAFVDFTDHPLVEWTQRTAVGVGVVDIDARGELAIAVEESSDRHVLHAYDTGRAVELWGKRLAGIVARDNFGHGGAAIAPDGSTVIVGTLRGGIRAFDGQSGSARWFYNSEGTTNVGFTQGSPVLVVANARLVPNGPLEGVLLFSTEAEPITAQVGVLAAVFAVTAAVVAVLVLGIGYWRLRRTY